MPRSFRHNLYLSLPVSKSLAQASASPGVSQSAVVEAALRQFFDPEQRPQAVLVRRLDHQGRAIERHLHHTELVLEALALFVQSYFNAVPPMAPGALEAKRFDAFISELGRRMASGKTLAADLLQSELTSQTQLPANDTVLQNTDTESPHAA
jgi:hypothetical protein